MNCIEFPTRRKYTNITDLNVLPPLGAEARAIQYCSEYNFFLMQRSPHSDFRAELSQGDYKVPDAKMLDRAHELPGVELHNLDIRTTSRLAQAVRSIDGHDFERPVSLVQSRILINLSQYVTTPIRSPYPRGWSALGRIFRQYSFAPSTSKKDPCGGPFSGVSA